MCVYSGGMYDGFFAKLANADLTLTSKTPATVASNSKAMAATSVQPLDSSDPGGTVTQSITMINQNSSKSSDAADHPRVTCPIRRATQR